MLKKLMHRLTNNLGLKILSLLFATILWLVVVNIDDPKITRTFTSTASIENGSYLSENGKYYEIKNNSNTVSFKVTGKRSYIEKMSNSDFKAVADLEAIEEESRIPVEISAQRYASNVTIANKNYYIDVAVEDLLSEPYIINVATTGELAEGRALGTVGASPTILRISGPASVMESIDKAVATIDVTGMASDMTDSVIPVLLDKEGNKVDSSDLTLNVQSVLVSAKILDTKSVGLTFTTTGEVEEGYEYVSTTYTPETIEIKGESKLLNTINTITIPEEVLDITDAAGNIEKTVDISSYLPEGISLVDTSAAKIQIVARIEKTETRNFEIPTANLTIKNLTSKFTLSFPDETMTVPISGLTTDLDGIDVSKITGTIDVGGLNDGEHAMTVTLNLEEKYTLDKTIKVMVELDTASTTN